MAWKACLCDQKTSGLDAQAFNNCLVRISPHQRRKLSRVAASAAFWQALCICKKGICICCAPLLRDHHPAYHNTRNPANTSFSSFMTFTSGQLATHKQGSLDTRTSLHRRAFRKGNVQVKLEDLDEKGLHDMDVGATQMGDTTMATLASKQPTVKRVEATISQQRIRAKAETHLSFANLLRESWMCHHGSTFVLTISSDVMDGPYVDRICQDLSLLHGLGIKLVIIPGTHIQIDRLLCEKGHKPHYVGSYRVTDDAALKACMEVAGKFQLGIEAKLSSQPSIPVLRRHGDNDRWHVGVGVASGNFIAAKRRGVVDGVDYGATGEVKRLDVARIKKRLDDNCIVILSNLGYSSSGEVLNCNTYEVATACARELQADKLISLLNGPFLDDNGRLIRFMTLQGADELIRKWAQESETAANYVKAVAGINYAKSLGLTHARRSKMDHANGSANGSAQNIGSLATEDNGNGAQRGHGLAIGGQEILSRDYGYLSELTAAVFVCRGGVQRVHLLDATIEGVLLLELYTRDGIGTMVASDRYEGTRAAEVSDLPKIEELLRPLDESGVLIKRSREQLLKELGSFLVVERDASIIACAALFPYYKEKCAEVAALAVTPECRGNGQGDKLLDYVENKAVCMGLESLFLLTTRTADWFIRRGFSQCTIDSIPVQRRARIDLTRGSKYYIKKLVSRSQN